jgi:predicted dehydrogenase
MESGVSVVFTMHGHSPEESRAIRIDGTCASLLGKFSDGLGDDRLEIHDHLSGKSEWVKIQRSRQSHGGGDQGVMRAFVEAARGDSPPLASARESFEGHLMAFAAEQSRLDGTIVNIPAFRAMAFQLSQAAP